MEPESRTEPSRPRRVAEEQRSYPEHQKPPESPERPREADLPTSLAEEQQDVPRRIHILGTGSIGRLVAHSLRDLPNPPPVSLIFHSASHWQSWQSSRQEIVIRTEGISVARSGFDAELQPVGFRRHGKLISKEEFIGGYDALEQGQDMDKIMEQKEDTEDTDVYAPEGSISEEPIHNLVLSVKAGITVSALMSVRHRLTPASTILFLQNGMGQIDEVDEEVFPNPETRPRYLSGVISHGVHTHPDMEATHAGFGTIAIGVPITKPSPTSNSQVSPSDMTLDGTSRYLLRTICRSPTLAAVPNSPTELLQAQLDKLAINAVINPITALLDTRNGALLYNFALTRSMRLLLGEISLVIRNLPELAHLPNVSTRFAPDRLETLVVGIAHKTRNNISSMLADTRVGQPTEVRYINGYMVKRGEEMGITCYMNYLIMQLVRGKQQLISHERQDDFPVAGSFEREDKDD